MPPLYDRLSPEKKKDITVLTNFIGIFCRENHRAGDKKEFNVSHPELQAQLPEMVLCSECSRLLEHGIAKLSLCSQNPKPSCRKCKAHCYSGTQGQGARGHAFFGDVSRRAWAA
jgi:hypothetical protein